MIYEKMEKHSLAPKKKTEFAAFSGLQNLFVRWSPLVPPWKQRFDPPFHAASHVTRFHGKDPIVEVVLLRSGYHGSLKQITINGGL